MRRRIGATAALFFIAMSTHAQQRGAVDWIFLVDTSASMRTNEVFDDVKECLRSFVREAGPDDSTALITFDSDARSVRDDNLLSAIDNLQADGTRTHLGLAITEGLDRAEALRNASKDPTRTQAVVLFTDGKEDVRGIRNPVPIPSNVQRVGDSYLFFVSMREHEPQLESLAGQTGNVRMLRAVSTAEIRRIAYDTRNIVHDKEVVHEPPQPQPAVLSINPIRLGEVKRGESIETSVTIKSDKPARTSLTLANAHGVSMKPMYDLAVPATVIVRLDVAEDAEPGPKALTFRASGASRTAELNVTKPSSLKWLVLIPIAIAAAFFAIRHYRRENRLEGALEILQPRLGPDDAYIGLPRLATNEIALSALVPRDALAGSDARLFVRRSNGQKKVCISARNGSLRINDVETPMTELYDADTIRIGDATLRFNHIGLQRATGEDL